MMVSLAWCGVALALAVRIGLIEWRASEWLGGRIEVSSPLTSWTRSGRGFLDVCLYCTTESFLGSFRGSCFAE